MSTMPRKKNRAHAHIAERKRFEFALHDLMHTTHGARKLRVLAARDRAADNRLLQRMMLRGVVEICRRFFEACRKR